MAHDLEPRRLRPRLARRLAGFVLSLLLLALCVAALVSSPLLGAVGVLLFGFAAVSFGIRLFHARAYATELDPEGFRTFDALGRPVHDVRWTEVEHFTVFTGNGLAGAGTALHLAWRCQPRRPGDGRQPWVRGGVNAVGEEYDGALPDPYLGIDDVVALFKRYADVAKGRRTGGLV